MEVDYEVLMDQISKSAAIGENTFIVSSYVFPFLNHLISIFGSLCMAHAHLDTSLYRWLNTPHEPQCSIHADALKR